MKNNEIVAFNIVLVSSEGTCVDISRTWWIGVEKPNEDTMYARRHANQHMMYNMNILSSGVLLSKLTMNCHKFDNQSLAPKYGCMMHGVGLCDE